MNLGTSSHGNGVRSAMFLASLVDAEQVLQYMRGHDRQNPVSNSDVANLNSVVPNCCFIRTEFKRAQQNLRLQDRI